jgi:hypothetical protein
MFKMIYNNLAFRLKYKFKFLSYASGISREGTELVVIAVSQVNRASAHGRRDNWECVHHNSDPFIQMSGTDITERVRKTERS